MAGGQEARSRSADELREVLRPVPTLEAIVRMLLMEGWEGPLQAFGQDMALAAVLRMVLGSKRGSRVLG